jgi:hypothetical protein
MGVFSPFLKILSRFDHMFLFIYYAEVVIGLKFINKKIDPTFVL